MKTEITKLIHKLNSVLQGTPWYNEPLIHKLESIDYKIANITPTGLNYSVARLVKHMINWRRFAIDKIEGKNQYYIELNSADDWPAINITSNEDWITLKKELVETHVTFFNLLQEKDDQFLEQTVQGREYNFYYLINGITEHDIYHSGQVAVVSRLAKLYLSDVEK
ncbi:MAG: hypothetical protein CMO01_18890 [Thalassobius sp.]|nr:hypothetical protein [Thalassovita sp.]|tara:strand:- start:10 stop:507 length:498 start_codon:yes stop_codon:yes gene_type:complete